MPTDEERREVAENLRYLTIGRHISYKEQFWIKPKSSPQSR